MLCYIEQLGGEIPLEVLALALYLLLLVDIKKYVFFSLILGVDARLVRASTSRTYSFILFYFLPVGHFRGGG